MQVIEVFRHNWNTECMIFPYLSVIFITDLCSLFRNTVWYFTWWGEFNSLYNQHTPTCLCDTLPGYHLWDIMDKFDSSPYSEHCSTSKMAAYIGGRHLQLKEQILICWTVGQFRGAFCLRSEVGDASEVTPRQTLNTNWAKSCHRVDLKLTLRHTMNASLVRWVQLTAQPTQTYLCLVYVAPYLVCLDNSLHKLCTPTCM